jgi:hypothetical protein
MREALPEGGGDLEQIKFCGALLNPDDRTPPELGAGDRDRGERQPRAMTVADPITIR